MALINVRAMPDRKAFTSPSGGVEITSDKWTLSQDSSWIRHLAKIGDIEIQVPVEAPAPVSAPVAFASAGSGKLSKKPSEPGPAN
jgi:hypothetical protein